MANSPVRAVEVLRQGDIVDGVDLPVLSPTGVVDVLTPSGIVLLSQTCDAVRTEKNHVLVSPAARLDGHKIAEAAAEKLLRYVLVPGTTEPLFADLSTIATLQKDLFRSLPLRSSIDPTDSEGMRRFGKGISRRFGRFAFPDEVVYWLRPLEKVVQRKHDKNSPEGEVLRDVLEFRVEATPDWSGFPLSLTLCVIVREGALPYFAEDDIPPCPSGLRRVIDEASSGRLASSNIASRLVQSRSSSDASETYWLWLALADSWGKCCRPDVSRLDESLALKVQSAVSGVDVDVLSEGDFSLYRYRRSEQLDLDHLSPPIPL